MSRLVDFVGDPTIDNSLRLQAAIDSLYDANRLGKGTLQYNGGTLRFADRYRIHSPVFIEDNTCLQGYGRQASQLWTYNLSSHGIIVGMRRNKAWLDKNKNPAFDTGHRIPSPLFVSRYSLWTKGDAFPVMMNCAPASGFQTNCWDDQQKLYFEVAVENPSGELGKCPILGLGAKEDFYPGPDPWRLDSTDNLYSSNQFELKVKVKEYPDPIHFTFGDNRVSGIVRISVAIDMVKGFAYAAVNGKQVAVKCEKAFTGCHMEHSLTGMFALGAYFFGPESIANPVHSGNLLFHGFLIGTECPYQDLGDGQDCQRIDGKAVTDVLSYMTPSADTLCYLTLTDKPNEPSRTSNKLITVKHGPATPGWVSWGLFQEDSNKFNNTNIENVQFKDFFIETEHGLGCAILCKNVTGGFEMDSVIARGGLHGIDLRGGYYYQIRNSTCNGVRAGVNAMDCIMSYVNPDIADVGTYGLHLRDTQANIRGLRAGNMNAMFMKTKALVKYVCKGGSYAGGLIVENVRTDNETRPFPVLEGLFSVEKSIKEQGYVYITDVASGSLDPASPLVSLTDETPSTDSYGVCTIENIWHSDPLICVANGKWKVRCKNIVDENENRFQMTNGASLEMESDAPTPIT